MMHPLFFRLSRSLHLAVFTVYFNLRVLSPQTTGNIHNFCEVGLKIAGTVPIYSPPALTYGNALLTSVAVSTTEQHTVGFLGTSDGHLKKVSHESHFGASNDPADLHIERVTPVSFCLRFSRCYRLGPTPRRSARRKDFPGSAPACIMRVERAGERSDDIKERAFLLSDHGPKRRPLSGRAETAREKASLVRYRRYRAAERAFYCIMRRSTPACLPF